MLWERITYKITAASFLVTLFSVLTFIRASSMISPYEMLLAHDGNNMGEQLQEPLGFQPGDKIRVRSGPQTGARGIIQAEKEGRLEIQLDDGNTILIEPGD